MKNIILTPFNFKLMKKYANVTLLLTLFLLFSFTFFLESAYEYSLSKQKEEYAESGELLSDTTLLYSLGEKDITEIKKYNFAIIDGKINGDVEKDEIISFKYEIVQETEQYNLLLIFDIYDLKFYEDTNDVYLLYEEEKTNNSFAFVFGTTEVYYQDINGKLNLINYNYLSFNLSEYNNLDDFGKVIARAFTQVYIDYKVSEFTVLSIILVIIFPIILTWIVFKFSGTKIPFTKYRHFFNVMVFSSIVPFIIIVILTIFIEMSVYFYDILLFIYFIYNIIKIGQISKENEASA